MRPIHVARAACLAFALCWFVSRQPRSGPPLAGRSPTNRQRSRPSRKPPLEQPARGEAEKGSQIAVLIGPTTAPETIEQYALRVAEQMETGAEEMDDGAVLVVAKNDRPCASKWLWLGKGAQ